ncbi:hypothetical protein Hanom_Chr03g00179411 [Helianthus anomalus]
MELTSHMKMARFQTFWIQMWKNEPLHESRKTGQTSGTKKGILLFFIIAYRDKKTTLLLWIVSDSQHMMFSLLFDDTNCYT